MKGTGIYKGDPGYKEFLSKLRERQGKMRANRRNKEQKARDEHQRVMKELCPMRILVKDGKPLSFEGRLLLERKQVL